ncbi:hypothetical protein HN682_00780 [Candidatus Peregrinibacteria bacterium]|nr:hypothetical protein [Candidatus Peregrinibacteria bacterium]
MIGIAQIKVGDYALRSLGIDHGLQKDDWVFILKADPCPIMGKGYRVTTDSQVLGDDYYWVKSSHLKNVLKYKK